MDDRRNGWIKYWRKSERNKLYFDEPFDKWHAWTDLLLMANPKDGSKGKPGTLKTSLEALRIRWSWDSRHRVRDFLGTLKGTLMIDFKMCKGKYGGTLITISNYEEYQATKEEKKRTKKQDDGNINGTTRRNTSYLPYKGRDKEGVFLESSPKGDSKNTFKEEKNVCVDEGKVFDPGEYLKQMREGER